MYKQLIRLTATYSFGAFLQHGINFLLLPLITFYLSTEAFAVIGLITILATFITTFFTTPITQGFTRHYYAPEYAQKRKPLTSTSLIYVLFISIVVAFGFYFFASPIALLVSSADFVPAFELYAICILVIPIANLGWSYLRLVKKARYYVFCSVVFVCVSLITNLICLIHFNMGIYALIWAIFMGNIVFLLMALPVLLKREFKHGLSFTFDLPIFKAMMRYGFPLVFTNPAASVMASGDRYVLTVFTPLSQVGIYTFGSQIASVFIRLLMTPYKQAVTPLMLEQESNKEKLIHFFAASNTYFLMFGMFIVIGLSAFAKELMLLLSNNKELLEAWRVSIILLFCALARFSGQMLGVGIIMAKKTGYSSAILVIGAIANITLNIIMIPHWGILGAAVATLIIFVLMAIVQAYFSTRLYDLQFNYKKMLHVILVGILVYSGIYVVQTEYISDADVDFSVSYFDRQLALIPYYLKMAAIKLPMIFSYLLILYITGFLGAKERTQLKKLYPLLTGPSVTRKENGTAE